MLKDCGCLRPKFVLEKHSSYTICKLARTRPAQIDCTQLSDEWKLLSLDSEVLQNLSSIKTIRIDHFWRTVFDVKYENGASQYPNSSLVVKTALSLSHGNADVEQSFSRSIRMLTSDQISYERNDVKFCYVHF